MSNHRNIFTKDTFSLSQKEALAYNSRENGELTPPEIPFTELVNNETIERLLNNFQKITNLAIALTDKNRQLIYSLAWPEVCTKYYRKNNTTNVNCLHNAESDTANISGEFKCQNGLWTYVQPIIIEGKTAARLYLSRFFYEHETVDYQKFKEDARRYNFKSDFIKQIKAFPIIPRERILIYIDFLSDLAQTLAQLGYSNLRLKRNKIIEKNQILAKLNENRKVLDAVFNSSPIAKILVNEDAKIVQINKTAQKYADAATGKLENKGPGDILNCVSSFNNPSGCGFGEHCNECKIRNSILKTFKTGESSKIEQSFLYIRHNEKLEKRIIKFSTNLIKTDKQNLVLLNIEDINETHNTKSALFKSQQRLDAFFKQSLDGFFFSSLEKPVVWNKDTDKEKALEQIFKTQRITKVNKALLDQYGYEDESELIGTTPLDNYAHNKGYDKQIWINFFDSGKLHVKLEQSKKDGSKIWIEGDYICMYDEFGRITGHFGVQRDITEAKKNQDLLIQTNKTLREANNAKDKFFSIIAHDLRGPFSALLGFSEMLKQNCRDGNYEDAKRQAELVFNSAKKSYSLLLNLLDWSRTQSGKINFVKSDIEINKLIDDIISVSEYSAIQKDLSIHKQTDGNIHIKADKNMLETIIRNLLGNAIKYSYRGKSIKIKAYKTQNKFTFEISDEGVGIKEDDIDKLFKIEHSHTGLGTEREKGTGLGLILCKEFVEKHNGQLYVESKFGAGSTFKFTIPAE